MLRLLTQVKEEATCLLTLPRVLIIVFYILLVIALSGCVTTDYEGYNSPFDMFLHSGFELIGIQDIPAGREKRMSPPDSFAALQRAPANQSERRSHDIGRSSSPRDSSWETSPTKNTSIHTPLPVSPADAPPQNEIRFSITPKNKTQPDSAPQAEISTQIEPTPKSGTQPQDSSNQPQRIPSGEIAERLEHLLLLYRTFQYAQVLKEVENIIRIPDITQQQKGVACLLAGASAYLLDDPLKTQYYLTLAVQANPVAHPNPDYFPSAVCHYYQAFLSRPPERDR